MARKAGVSRRDFLKGAAAAVAAPYVLTSAALGAAGRSPASERIVMGAIGVGGRGMADMGTFLGFGEVQVVAVCDADRNRLQAAKKRVEEHYSKDAPGTYAGCKDYSDFRELLERPDIDSVVIATPDHWHGLISARAAKAGKDIYCEKPMASTIGDGRAAADAVRRYGRVFQTGSQERSTANCRYACELVLNGRIGKLHTIRCFLPERNKASGARGPEPVPEGFDYDMWLGPAPWGAYHPRRCHGSFRWILDYSDGELTDRGAHVNDIALLGAGPLLVGPVEIEGRGKFIRDPLWDTAYEYHIEFAFASGLKMIVDSGNAPGAVVCSVTRAHRGVLFQGTEGWIFVAIHGGALMADPPEVLKSPIRSGEIRLGRSPGHSQDWVRAIKTRGPTMAPAEDGHRTASFCHLCTIACQLERKLKWDYQREQFINDEEANRHLDRPKREPWRI